MKAFETPLKGAQGAAMDIHSAEGSPGATAAPRAPAHLDPETARTIGRICGRTVLRRIRIALVCQAGEQLSREQVMERFGVSRATAARDLAALRQADLQPSRESRGGPSNSR